MNTRIPDGMPQLTPMLICADAAAELEFCKTVFEATELNRRHKNDGSVGHGLLVIGRAMVTIEGEFSMLANRAPPARRASSTRPDMCGSSRHALRTHPRLSGTTAGPSFAGRPREPSNR